MLRLRPVSRSHRAARMWTCAPPPRLRCSTAAPRVAIGFESGPSRPLELIENRADLLVGRSVVGRPGDHARGVLVIEPQRVGHRSHSEGISPQQLDAFARLPARVPLAEEVVGRRRCRAGSAGEELNEHRPRGSRREPVPGAPARWRPDGRRFDGLGHPLVGIRPPGDLVEVVADTRQLAGALALDLGVRHGSRCAPGELEALAALGQRVQIDPNQSCCACTAGASPHA